MFKACKIEYCVIYRCFVIACFPTTLHLDSGVQCSPKFNRLTNCRVHLESGIAVRL